MKEKGLELEFKRTDVRRNFGSGRSLKFSKFGSNKLIISKIP